MSGLFHELSPSGDDDHEPEPGRGGGDAVPPRDEHQPGPGRGGGDAVPPRDEHQPGPGRGGGDAVPPGSGMHGAGDDAPEHAELVEGEAEGGNGGGSGPAGDQPDELLDLTVADDLSGLETLLSDDFGRISAERDEYLDALKRLQADFDNYRKRMERQQADMRSRASEGLVSRLLPVLDSLDLAIAHLGLGDSSPTDEASVSLLQVNTQLRDILRREGLERIDAVGVGFDPTVHEATAIDDAEPEASSPEPEGGAEGNEPSGPTVTEVWRSGYRLGDRVIRPAMVRVRG